MAVEGRWLCPQLLLLLLLLLLSVFAPTSRGSSDFEDDSDDSGDLALDRRADGGRDASSKVAATAVTEASAELAGEAALGGLQRRLELDEALNEAVRAGRSAVRELRRQADELRQLRAENAELRSVAAAAAAAAEAAVEVTDAAATPTEKRTTAVEPPPAVAEDAGRDRDLRRLAGLLAKHESDGEVEAEAEGGACFPAGTPLANCAQVRRRFGLTMDAEAAALCDSHRLCAACAGHYGIPADACDRAFVSVAAGLCLREADPVACGRQADGLLAAARAAHAPADSVAADVIGCSRPCAARLLATVRGN